MFRFVQRYIYRAKLHHSTKQKSQPLRLALYAKCIIILLLQNLRLLPLCHPLRYCYPMKRLRLHWCLH